MPKSKDSNATFGVIFKQFVEKVYCISLVTQLSHSTGKKSNFFGAKKLHYKKSHLANHSFLTEAWEITKVFQLSLRHKKTQEKFFFFILHSSKNGHFQHSSTFQNGQRQQVYSSRKTFTSTAYFSYQGDHEVSLLGKCIDYQHRLRMRPHPTHQAKFQSSIEVRLLLKSQPNKLCFKY